MEWNEKSDIWSAACILAELYSGELLFNAHHDGEHLGMIEKVAGPFPKWISTGANKETAKLLFGLEQHGMPSKGISKTLTVEVTRWRRGNCLGTGHKGTCRLERILNLLAPG